VHSLIFESDVICAFNSTMILEAGLSGKPVIVPYLDAFRESSRLAQGVSMGEEMEGAFDIARTPKNLIEWIEHRLENPELPGEMMAKRRYLFEKWVSPLTADALTRYHLAIRDVIELNHFRVAAPIRSL
jgi:hypothetical protein